ncbi:MAG: acyl-CoA thioesterase II [Archangium sp.]|nr:acyl-CoA thioesterase II [Archangium sp.]
MAHVLDQLVSLLSLEKIEENLFRGQSQDLGWGRVYGGQVIGQALAATLATVPADRTAHSLHAYFLRPGDVAAPIVYQVSRSRDGSSFTTRHVTAIQHGQPIFDMSASFQKPEEGFEHMSEMPKVPPPEEVPTEQERMKPFVQNFPDFMRERILAEHPIEIRTVAEPDPTLRGVHPPQRQVWFKTTHKVADTPVLHQALLAYASDFSFITTSLKPHGKTWISRGMQVASIDHAVWFHAPFRADEWLLHVMDSPRASGARGLVRGQIFSRDGKLVASTTQEGLIRFRKEG